MNQKSQNKLIIVAFFILFGITWMNYITPIMENSIWFNNLNPVEAYIVYNIGLISIFAMLFGIPIGYFITGNTDIFTVLRFGFLSFIGFSWVIDLSVAPYAWARDGTLAIPLTNQNMEIASVDYMWGWIFQQLGAHGHWIYDLTYSGVLIMGILVIAFMYTPAKILKILGVK
jgi:hypothetical protein